MDQSGSEDCVGSSSAYFDLNLHRRFFLRCLNSLPNDYSSGDTSRLSLCFFALSGLDMLQSLPLRPDQVDSGVESGEKRTQSNVLVKESQRKELIDWIYAQQVDVDVIEKAAKESKACNLSSTGQIFRDQTRKDPNYKCIRSGFRGGPWMGISGENSMLPEGFLWQYDGGHLAMTYTALACLIILGDDLSRVKREEIVLGMKYLQLKDGR